MGKIDDTDMKILAELIKDASLSVPKLSKKINVNASVVYSRIKRLLKRRLVKRFTVDVNDEILGYVVTAIIGVNMDAKFRESIIDELVRLNEVREVSEVTGRFDLLVVVRTRSLDELHDTVSGRIGRINGVSHTETFIEMKRKEREPHYSLPK